MLGSRRERETRAAHPAESAQRDGRPCAVVRPDRGHVQLGEPTRHDLGADAARDLGLVVERQEGDDRERRHAAHRLDRNDELLEVEEGLDHEEIHAAPLEHPRLGGVQRAVLGGVEHLELAERADRARDEDVAARDLARLAGEPDAGGVDRLERVVEQHAGELAAIRAEGVRLDQLRPRRDVARVDGDDALRRAEVRLLGAAQAGHRLRDQRARAAVRDDRRAVAQAFEETAHGSAMLVVSPGATSAPRRIGRSGAAAVAPLRHESAPDDGNRPPSRPSGVR